MEQLLWEIIEESKSGKPFLNSEEQFKKLEEILTRHDRNTVQAVHENWREKSRWLYDNNQEFELLHAENGGIVCSGDDGFYMDFANWLIAQGEQLFNQFKQEGHKAVLNYIKENNIEEDDYMFECFVYAFHDYLD